MRQTMKEIMDERMKGEARRKVDRRRHETMKGPMDERMKGTVDEWV